MGVADFSGLAALNKLGERYGKHGKGVFIVGLQPGSKKLVEKAGGLLVKELILSGEAEVMPTQHTALRVESFGSGAVGDLQLLRNRGTSVQDSADDAELDAEGLRHRREEVLTGPVLLGSFGTSGKMV